MYPHDELASIDELYSVHGVDQIHEWNGDYKSNR